MSMVSEVQSPDYRIFAVRVNDGPERQVQVWTGIQPQVAAAGIAALSHKQSDGPAIIRVTEELGESFAFHIGPTGSDS